jgi:toxin YoeB
MNRDVIFQGDAWEEYLYWQIQDKKTLKRIHELIKDIKRNGNTGMGKPEPLKHKHQGYWSRRIDDAASPNGDAVNNIPIGKRPAGTYEKNRLVYRIQNEIIDIIQCGSHYDD